MQIKLSIRFPNQSVCSTHQSVPSDVARRVPAKRTRNVSTDDINERLNCTLTCFWPFCRIHFHPSRYLNYIFVKQNSRSTLKCIRTPLVLDQPVVTLLRVSSVSNDCHRVFNLSAAVWNIENTLPVVEEGVIDAYESVNWTDASNDVSENYFKMSTTELQLKCLQSTATKFRFLS